MAVVTDYDPDPGPNRQLNPQRQFSISVRLETYDWLTDLAYRRQSSITQICRDAIRAYREAHPDD